MNKIESVLENYSFAQKDDLIPILQDIQDQVGYLSEEAIVEVGKYLDMSTSKIYGLATFYNKFRFSPKGKYHIRICNGASCHVNANSIILKELYKQLETVNEGITKDGIFSIEETNCLGACGMGPVIAVNNKYYTKLDISKLKEIIDFYKNLEE